MLASSSTRPHVIRLEVELPEERGEERGRRLREVRRPVEAAQGVALEVPEKLLKPLEVHFNYYNYGYYYYSYYHITTILTAYHYYKSLLLVLIAYYYILLPFLLLFL